MKKCTTCQRMRQEESKTLMMLTLNYCTNPRCFPRSSRQSFFALILSSSSASGLLVTRGNCQLLLLSEFHLKCAPQLRVFITPETRWRSLLFLLLTPISGYWCSSRLGKIYPPSLKLLESFFVQFTLKVIPNYQDSGISVLA